MISIKVTVEHTLYSIQKTTFAEASASQAKPLTFWEYLKTESLTKKLLENIFK